MIRATFALGIALSLATAAVFLLNYVHPLHAKRGHYASLLCAFQCLGWALLLAKHMGWGARWISTPLIAASLPVSLLSLLVLLNARRQR